MKISVMCQSILLQEAIVYYLQGDLSDFKDCDFIISDKPLNTTKPVCLIDNSEQTNIKKPFTKISLLQDVQDFYYSKFKSSTITANPTPKNLLDIKNPELKMQIDSLLEEFSRKIYQTFKKHEE